MVPSAQHGVHGAAEVARHGVLFQVRIEIEARRNAEAFEWRAAAEHKSRRREPRFPFRETAGPAAACSRMRRAISSASRSMLRARHQAARRARERPREPLVRVESQWLPARGRTESVEIGIARA